MKFSLRHQSTGKIYPYIERISPLMYYGIFRKVNLYNCKSVPSDKPVLLAANHPTAFVEPCLMCNYFDPPVYHMTRGDIFQKPFFRKLMEGVNMFPVYRIRDGFSGRDRNEEVFGYCINKMREGRVLNVFVEGEHHLEKRVRPVKKGIAHIAFAAYERHRLEDLQIIPVGSNYVHGDRTRDVVMLNVGDPIYVKDYWDAYQSDPAATIQRLCNDIESALKSICYHVENPADHKLAEQLLTLHRSEHPEPPLPVVVYDGQRFMAEKKVLDRLNELPADKKSALRSKTDRYFSLLEQEGVDDAALMNPQWGNPAWMLFFIAGLLPFLVGYISSWPLIRLAKNVADKKVKKVEFYTSVRMGVGFLAGIPYYLLLFLCSLITGKPFWIAFGLLLPALGWFSMFYQEMWARWRAAGRATGHPQKETLLRLRGDIAQKPRQLPSSRITKPLSKGSRFSFSISIKASPYFNK